LATTDSARPVPAPPAIAVEDETARATWEGEGGARRFDPPMDEQAALMALVALLAFVDVLSPGERFRPRAGLNGAMQRLDR
jgi:hypothetical protein